MSLARDIPAFHDALACCAEESGNGAENDEEKEICGSLLSSRSLLGPWHLNLGGFKFPLGAAQRMGPNGDG